MSDIEQRLRSIIKTDYPAVLYINFKELGRVLLICQPNELTEKINELFKIREKEGIEITRAQDYMRETFLPLSLDMMMLFKSREETKISKKQSHLSNYFILHLGQNLWKLMVNPDRKVESFMDKELNAAIEELKCNLKNFLPQPDPSAKFIATQLAWLAFQFPNLCLYAFSPVSLSETVDCLHFILLEDGTAQMPSPEQIREYFLVSSRNILEIISEVRWQLFLRHVLRSAIAAIMGRNMSHNIGSHAIWHLAEQLKNSKVYNDLDIEGFLRYLQKRMDFIAQVSTSAPSWCLTMKWGEIVKGFTDQRCLLDNIAWSHKVRYCDDWFTREVVSEEQKPEVKLIVKQVPRKSENGTEKEVELSVDIPHGQIGAQAFYTILENLIRNTAKYGDRSSAPPLDSSIKKLEFTIKIEDDWDDGGKGWQEDYYRVSIRDNWVTRKEVVTHLNKSLAAPIIDPETAELKPGNWGMKEIKICAAYLRMVRPEEIDAKYEAWKDGKDDKEPPMIEVKLTNDDWQEVQQEGQQEGHLTYVLYMLRPKEALLVGEDLRQAAEKGGALS